VEDLASEIDQLMTGIASRTGVTDSTRIAILAALHIADQLKTARADLEAVRDSIQERSKRMTELLDQLS
jgi:cell division protein ZapA (FtsZ GTPase activity inhibitor)